MQVENLAIDPEDAGNAIYVSNMNRTANENHGVGFQWCVLPERSRANGKRLMSGKHRYQTENEGAPRYDVAESMV